MPTKHSNFKATLHIVLPYVLFAGLWILLSDRLLETLVADAAAFAKLSIYKGWAFVFITALLLALLLHLQLRERQRAYAALEERGAAIERSNREIALANASLLESERKYHELVTHANSIILHWSHDGRIISLNEYGQRFFGYTQDEIRGRHVVGTIVPETEKDGRDLRPLMEEICRDPAAFEQNVNENIRRDGEHVWIAWTNKVVLDPRGQVTEVLSIGTDITARKRVEDALRATQANLEERVALRTKELAEREAFARALAEEQELLLRNIQVGVLFSADGKILKVNPKFAEIFGYANPEELAGGDPRQLFPTVADFDRFMAATGKVFATGGVLDVESNGIRRDGSLFYGRTIASAIQAPGHRHASIWIVEDIGARKAAQREIADLNTLLQAVIDNTPNPIFYKGADLRFLGCNRAYEQVFGVVRADFIGKTVLDLAFLPPADRAAYQAEDAAAVAAGATVRREAAIPFVDGRTHQTLYSVSGFRRPDGSPGGLVGIIVDITPLKEAEAALAEAKYAAEAADRLKSAFLATMSHELRTPLNSIIGFTGILLQELAGPLNAEQHKQLGMVQGSARHLLALINDVLDISKIEAGELSVACEAYDLAASIEKVADIVAPLAQKKGLALRLEGIANAGPMRGDSRRVEQILLNLLSNAIKFTETGSVAIGVDRIENFAPEAGSAPGPALRLRIMDTGIGILPQDMVELFKPFRQIDSTLSRKHEGTGLGLAICRRLATLMGGRIDAESRYGAGSTFSLILPLHTLTTTETSMAPTLTSLAAPTGGVVSIGAALRESAP